MKLVKCVKVKSELKVQPLGEEGFVQFPKDLREEGKVFAVENLVKSGKFWRVQGEIFELKSVNSNNDSEEEKYIEFCETCDHEGETWYFYAPKSLNNLTELIKVFDLYKKLDEEEGMGEYSYKEVSKSLAEKMIKREGKTGYLNEFNNILEINIPSKGFDSIQSLDDIQDYLYKARAFKF